jgi:N-acetylmuramoyl-L-alanine amidase
MAQNINAQLETVGFVNLGVQARPNLVVLRRTQMLAVLVEVGFINSDVDNQLFDANFDDIALAIAEGILDTLNNTDQEEEGWYSVQTGAFRNRRYAENLLRELQEMEFPARIEMGDGYYRVQVGRYANLNEAVRMEQRLKRAGYPTVIVS